MACVSRRELQLLLQATAMLGCESSGGRLQFMVRPSMAGRVERGSRCSRMVYMGSVRHAHGGAALCAWAWCGIRMVSTVRMGAVRHAHGGAALCAWVRCGMCMAPPCARFGIVGHEHVVARAHCGTITLGYDHMVGHKHESGYEHIVARAYWGTST